MMHPTTSSQGVIPNSALTGPATTRPNGRATKDPTMSNVDPGQLVLGDILLDGQVPVDAEDLESEAVQCGAGEQDEDVVGERHRDRERCGEREHRGPDEQASTRPPPQ